jgi:DUF1365 family protein
MKRFRSTLYECRVWHHRLEPKEHQFRHNVFMFWLDLDELDQIPKNLALFSHNKFNAYSFYDRDHLAEEGETIKENIFQWLKQNNVELQQDDKVMLLTFPRVFGYTFNPVSFYFCFRKSGDPFCAIAEVSNTFKERKRFLLPTTGSELSNRFELRAPKHFYVSPFAKLDIEFHFRLRVPNSRMSILVDDYEGPNRILTTSLTGRQKALTNSRLAWFTLRYPLITLKVIFLIHFQALLLYLKRIPLIGKAANPELQIDVLIPGTKSK